MIQRIKAFIGTKPYRTKYSSSIWCSKDGQGNMLLQVMNQLDGWEVVMEFAENALVDALNGAKKQRRVTKSKLSNVPFTLSEDGVFFQGEKGIFLMRGWGCIQYLDNPGELQDKMAEFILDALNQRLKFLQEG